MLFLIQALFEILRADYFCWGYNQACPIEHAMFKWQFQLYLTFDCHEKRISLIFHMCGLQVTCVRHCFIVLRIRDQKDCFENNFSLLIWVSLLSSGQIRSASYRPRRIGRTRIAVEDHIGRLNKFVPVSLLLLLLFALQS